MQNKNIDKSKNLSADKLKNQCRTTEAALKHCFSEVFGNHKVLDKVIANYFRNNKKFGSRDRQLINESVFAVFRYFGIVSKLVEPEELTAITTGATNYSGLSLGKMIYAALSLNNNDFVAMEFWKKSCNSITLRYNEDPLIMAYELFRKLNLTCQTSISNIIPEHLQKYISPQIDVQALLKNLSERPPMWIRMQNENNEKILGDFRAIGFDFAVHPYINNAVSLNNPKINLYTLDTFKKGFFEVQDLASQVIGLVANPKKTDRWLDVCAGAGGKTLQLATIMERKGTVVATDIRPYKLQDLKLRARRAAFPNIMIKEFENGLFRGKNAGKYDGVLVDAPCTCSGVWRRNADSRWTLQESEISEISQIQLEILENSCSAVKTEGFLVYATCSIFSVENEDVVNAFLAKHPEFKLVSFTNPLDNSICESGMLQVDISKNNCDSMFVAKMMKK